MTSSRTRLRPRYLVPAALVATVLCVGPFPALAQEPAGIPPGDITFRTELLGFGETVRFRGHSDAVTVTVPVPDGMRPASLDTTVQLPVNVARGWIDVDSDLQRLARVELPAGGDLVPISLPLDAAPVRNNASVITLRLNLSAVDNICPEDWTDRSALLRDSVVRYTGGPTEPAVVADFLPPVLDGLELYLPATPSAAESGTALDLAAAITTRYNGRPPAVSVRELPANRIPSAPENAFVRQIVVTEGGEPGAELRGVPGGPPALYLTGEGDALSDQTHILTSALSGFAVAAGVGATGDSPGTAPRLGTDSTTLHDLGIGDVTTSALGYAEAHLFFDQARFGRPVGDLRVDLKGSYTPLPDTEGGLVTVAVGDTVLDSWAADAGGLIDRSITVPASAMQRVTDVTVSLRTTGGGLQCGLQQPVTVTIEGGSRVTSTVADTPAPDGFASLPQTLMPFVNVAATGDGIVDTARAVELLARLQALTPAALDPRWVSVDDALSESAPAIVVAADGPVPEDLPLLLAETEDRRFDVTGPDGETTSLTFGTAVEYASLQVLRDAGRTVLVATSTDVPAELDRTLAWLGAEPDRWATLTGHVLFTAPGREPVPLSVPAADSAVADTQTAAGSSVGWILAVTGALVVAGLVAALAILRSRRNRPRRA